MLAKELARIIVAIVVTIALAIGSSVDAQERQQKPVTQASLVRSLLNLSDKAAKAGRDKDAAIILKAAQEILNQHN